MNPRSTPRIAARPVWQLLLVLFAVFATGAQQLVAQTHFHAAEAAHAGSGAGSEEGQGGHDHCLLCQVAAQSTAAAPPSMPLWQLAPPPHGCLFHVEFQQDFVPPPAHAWQSRGPPRI